MIYLGKDPVGINSNRGGEPLIVPEFTYNEVNDEYTCDMTFQQVYDACELKQCPYAVGLNQDDGATGLTYNYHNEYNIGFTSIIPSGEKSVHVMNVYLNQDESIDIEIINLDCDFEQNLVPVFTKYRGDSVTPVSWSCNVPFQTLFNSINENRNTCAIVYNREKKIYTLYEVLYSRITYMLIDIQPTEFGNDALCDATNLKIVFLEYHSNGTIVEKAYAHSLKGIVSGSFVEKESAALENHSVGDMFLLALESSDSTYDTINNLLIAKATAPITIGDRIIYGTNCVYTNLLDEINNMQSNSVQDIQVNGTSVLTNGVANVPIATSSTPGVVIPDPTNGIGIESQNKLYINYAPSDLIKSAVGSYRPITPPRQHESVFYGLAKAAGDSTQASSSNTVGTYTAGAKTAIKTMLGVIDPSVTDVQINSNSVLSNGVANIPLATSSINGVVHAEAWGGVQVNSAGLIYINKALSSHLKAGTNQYLPITSAYEDYCAFYGLAKASGDTTQSASENSVGNYTPEAKAAIWNMLGLDGSAFTKSDWELIREDTFTNETEADHIITVDGNGNAFELTDVRMLFELPKVDAVSSKGYYGQIWFYYTDDSRVVSEPGAFSRTTTTDYAKGCWYFVDYKDGMVMLTNGSGTTNTNNGNMKIRYVASAQADADKEMGMKLFSDFAIKKINIKSVTGTGHYKLYGKRKRAALDSPVINVSGTTPSITALPGHRYICGECATLSLTPPASGDMEVIFTSGSTATVLTVPNTVKFPAWFNPSSLDPNCTYDMIITNGTLGVVTAWA